MKNRKLLASLLAIFIVITNIQLGFAIMEWNSFSLDEIGLTLSLPKDFDVFTRNMPSHAPVLSEYQLSSSEVDEILISGNLYLDAYSPDGTKEIAVNMIGSAISDFSNWEDNTLSFMASMWLEGFKQAGTIIDSYDIYHSGDITYVRMWQHAADDPSSYALQYYTTYNYQAVNITTFSYGSKITETDEQLMLDIVNSAIFGDSTGTVAYYAPTDSSFFQYETLSNGTAKIIGYSGNQASISVPESIDGHVVTAIGNLENNFSVTSIFIPATVEKMDENPFYSFSGLKAISVDEKSTSYIADGGVLYTFDQKKLICYPSQLNNKTFVVPSNTITIGKNSFYGNDHLIFVEISEGVEKIESDAFACSDGITDIHLPKSLKQIDGNPFAFSYGLMSISVDPLNPCFYAQDGVLFNRTEKSLQVFPYNKTFERYSIPEGIIFVGEDAFKNHLGDATIVFPNSLQKIGAWAFNGCSNFHFPQLMSNVIEIGEFAFDDCDTIDSVIIHGDALLGKRAFGDCSNLINAKIEEGITDVSNYLFFGCKSLQNVELPSTLTSIGEHAFEMCESLEALKIPASVEHIGECAFEDCSNLTLLVTEASYAEQYCKNNNLKYDYYQESAKTDKKNIYLDPVSGMSFPLPAGWIQEEMSKERTYLDAKFVPEKNDGKCIVFSCEDLWMSIEKSERLALEQMGYSRKDFDNTLFSFDDIADTYSIDQEDIYLLNFSNQEFFAAEIIQQQELFGYSFPFKATILTCVRNGYMYLFQFSGASDSDAYKKLMDEMLSGIVW